ncbi:MAG TPA: SdpI family protein [Pirellulales bacterium]|nr:SdpI family protein [Pirellulales bacterium]
MITRNQGIVLGLLWLGDWALGFWAIATSPDRVPVHWNWKGEVDRYGSPWELGILAPLLFTITLAVLPSLPYLSSQSGALKRSGPMYGRMIIIFAITIIAMNAAMICLGGNHPSYLLRMVLVTLAMMLLIVGNWMGKIRRNSVMGIRTPWTLKSDYVWERTHRLGGRLQVAHGISVLLAAFLLPVWAGIVVLMGGLLLLCAWAMFYSRSLARGESRDHDQSQPVVVP